MSKCTMKTLNFFPYYEKLLKNKQKNVTIRFGDQRAKYSVGDNVLITIGWTQNNSNIKLDQVEIVRVDYKKIKDLTRADIIGESPDCSRKANIPYVLSAIYRRIVSEDDYVTIVKWKRMQNSSEVVPQNG